MSEHEMAVRIHDIHKEFILPQSKNTSMKQAAVNIVRRNNKVTQKVLDGVSFDIHKGDFFGIVGRNGSGKSTLLKLIAGVYTPTKGSIDVNGGLTPFIELGVGFNPELSGHDNVYLNGALLGFSRTQMNEMYDEIVEFAELGPFMDQKLKNYSSGMQVRLAFSIAIMAKNDVLIFDEVLAVGDEAFQRKCLDIFEDYKASGQTVVLVSHDMETVRRFCTRAALVSEGKLVMVGDPQIVADKYTQLNLAAIGTSMGHTSANEAMHIHYLDDKGSPSNSVDAGKTLRIGITHDLLPHEKFVVVNIYKRSGEHITGFRIESAPENIVDIAAYLAPGKYTTLMQRITADDRTVGEGVYGPEFIVTSSKNLDRPGWSGLVPIDYRIVR